jgi:hypothetical protein
MRFVICYPKSKRPIGKDWPNHTLTAEEVDAHRKTHPHDNVGIVFGPASGVVDVECDSDEATDTYKKLFPDPTLGVVRQLNAELILIWKRVV